MGHVEQSRLNMGIAVLPTSCEGGGYGATAIAEYEDCGDGVEHQAERKDI